MENTSSFPRLNEPAPAFKVNTTHGERSLDDYKGKWLILFSHPADFTPVCTTEFIAFAKAADTFKRMNCELLGLSIDSIYSHLAWMQSIKNSFDVEIPFPIIDDIKMDVARSYGMIHPGAADTQAVRATFFIDPEGKLRAMVYYPMSNGRSIDEFVRLVRFPGWQNTKAGEREVQKALRKVIYVKYQVKDQDLFDKAFGYIRQYY